MTNSFIQQIVQPSYDTIALYTYKTNMSKTILICLAPGVCRIHETKKSIPKNDKPLRFMEFLRSRVKGSRIVSAEQLGLERIIKITLIHGDETLFMYIRLWSGAANCIVTQEDGTILDVFFRRPKRGEVTGGMYVYENGSGEKSTLEFPIRPFNAKEQTFSEYIDQWYDTNAQTLSREALLVQAKKIYNTKKTKMTAALDKLKKKQEVFLKADRWKQFGDLLFAHLHEIKEPLSSFECLDYETNVLVAIPLDVKKSVKENAQIYYEQYKKAQSGLVSLADDIALAERSLVNLQGEYDSLCVVENPLIIQQLLRRQNKPKQQIEKKYPGLYFDVNGWRFLVGRTASENDELLRRHVRGQDMWFHARDYAGGYVFIKMQRGKTIPLETMLAAGNLALYFSKGRKNASGDIYYTQVKYLRRAKNAPKGTVLPAQEKNLSIKLDEKLIKKVLHPAVG